MSPVQESAGQAGPVSAGERPGGGQQEQAAARDRMVKGIGAVADARRLAAVAGLALAGMILRIVLVPGPLLVTAMVGILACSAASTLAVPWAVSLKARNTLSW